MRNLFHPQISQSEVDDLYNGTLIPRKTRPIILTGTGVIKRGAPLVSDDGETFTVWAMPAAPDPIPVIRGILLYDVDTAETEEAENAVLGLSGEFNQNKIEEALGDVLDPSAVMDAWGKQIHIEKNYEYPAPDANPLG